MKKLYNGINYKLRYICLFIILGLGILTIVGTGGGGGGDENDTGTEEQIPSSSDTKAISSEGGIIRITDEDNNIIEVVFPKDALEETTQITLQLQKVQPTLPIETQHIPTFEIKPYDLELGYPIILKVTYAVAVQNIQVTTLFRKKSDILLPLADSTFGLDAKSVQGETFSLGVFAEGSMSLEQIDTQVGLILSAYGVDWDYSNLATAEAAISTTNYFGIWKGYREDARALLRYAISAQLLGFENMAYSIMASICSDILEPAVDELLSEGIPADPCERDYTYTLLDVAVLAQEIGCSSVDYLINDQVQAIWENCSCFTFNSTDNVNLTSIYFIGVSTSLSLYGDGTFSAKSSLGATSGWWIYSDTGIMLTPEDQELDTARLVIQKDQVCEGDKATLIIPSWVDEWGEYYPPESVALKVLTVQLAW